jgi:hypothetical protein
MRREQKPSTEEMCESKTLLLIQSAALATQRPNPRFPTRLPCATPDARQKRALIFNTQSEAFFEEDCFTEFSCAIVRARL